VAQQTDRAPLNWAVIVDLRSSAEDIAFLNWPQNPQTSMINLSHRRLPHDSVVLSWLLQNGANVVVLVDYALSFMYHIRGLSTCILRGCRMHDRQRNVVMQVNEYKLHWLACSFNPKRFPFLRFVYHTSVKRRSAFKMPQDSPLSITVSLES
jgi:hypothetical protein